MLGRDAEPVVKGVPGVRVVIAALLAAALVPLAGCDRGEPRPGVAVTSSGTASPTALSSPTGAPTASPATSTAHVAGQAAGGTASPSPANGGATAAPDWLGTRVLPTDTEGIGLARTTPPELVDRRIVTVDELPAPVDGAFRSRVRAVPPDVAARSTWTTGCPVGLDDLRYVTVSFRGFDGRAHTGELLVHRSVADDVVSVFRRLFAAGYPIERMHITTPEELDAAPTGDGNTTSAFVCRSAVGTTRWSEHAYGRAIDVNPFHNPYVKGRRVLPELAVAYADRRRGVPGMIMPGGPVVRAFRDVGWEWGGGWRSAKDYMHFSVNGR